MAGKTNAMRMLDRAKIPYTQHSYDVSDGLIDGVSVAHKTGQNPDQVFKTLVTSSGSQLYVFVIPVAKELDLKKAAREAGEKRVEMIHVKDILKFTGYIRGGCSPMLSFPLPSNRQKQVFVPASRTESDLSLIHIYLLLYALLRH